MPATASKPTTKSTIKILYAECDEKVLASHAAEIQKAGHHVTTALSRQAVVEQLRRDAFDLVILGSTMSKDDRHHLPYMVKKAHEGTKVLVMHAGARHHAVDAAVDSGIGMVFLLEKISPDSTGGNSLATAIAIFGWRSASALRLKRGQPSRL